MRTGTPGIDRVARARDTSMSVEAPSETALAYLRHLEGGDLSAAMLLFAEGAVVRIPGHQEMSKAQFREFLEFAHQSFLGSAFITKPIGITAANERVAVEAESHALLKSGEPYENRYHLLFVVRDGKLHEMNVYASGPLAAEAAWNRRRSA